MPIQEVDLDVWRVGGEAGGEDPDDYAFRFKAEGVWYDIQVRVLDKQGVFLGWEWECELVERFCEFRVDGARGWGVSEFNFRRRSGRPREVEVNDPEYARKAPKP